MMAENKIYVAVGKEVEEHKLVLTWSLQNSGGKRVSIIHVHQPDKRIPTPIGYLAAENVSAARLQAHRDEERLKMSAILDKYAQIYETFGVSLEKLYIEDDSIEKGIIKLIQQHTITKLVMGAAANRHHNNKMTNLRSKKAIYVREHAPPSCLIWFVCKNLLIHTRNPITTEKDPNDEGNGHGQQAPTASAPPFTTPEEIAARWSYDTGSGSDSVSRSSSGRPEAHTVAVPRDSFEATSIHPPSLLSIHHSFLSRDNEQGSALQTMYIEECRKRQEVEAELQRVKLELEWIKTNEAKFPKAMEELDYMKTQVSELTKLKTELDFIKNGVLVELRSAIEQKALLENQIRNSTVLLQMLGEKLGSAITLFHNYGEQ